MTILRFYHRYIVNSSLMQHRYGDFKAELIAITTLPFCSWKINEKSVAVNFKKIKFQSKPGHTEPKNHWVHVGHQRWSWQSSSCPNLSITFHISYGHIHDPLQNPSWSQENIFYNSSFFNSRYIVSTHHALLILYVLFCSIEYKQFCSVEQIFSEWLLFMNRNNNQKFVCKIQKDYKIRVL